VWLSVEGCKAYSRTLAPSLSSGSPSISALAGVWRPPPISRAVAAARDLRRLRRKRPAPARSRTPTMQPMTMPAMAPPESLLLDEAAARGVDVDEAMKTVVVEAGDVDEV
jgi:hypothetical protein